MSLFELAEAANQIVELTVQRQDKRIDLLEWHRGELAARESRELATELLQRFHQPPARDRDEQQTDGDDGERRRELQVQLRFRCSFQVGDDLCLAGALGLR